METNQIKRCKCFTKMLYHFSVDEILQHLRERIEDVGPLESVTVHRKTDGSTWADGKQIAISMISGCNCEYSTDS